MWVKQEQSESKDSLASVSDHISVHCFFLIIISTIKLCISASVQDYEIEYMEKIGSSSAVSISLLKTENKILFFLDITFIAEHI